MLKPKFSYKIFNRAGTLIGNLPIDRVKSEPRFSEAINGGQGNMTVLLAGNVLDSPVSVWNIVHVLVFWEGYASDGEVIYRGSVEKITRVLDTSEQVLSVELYGLAYFLQKVFYRSSGNVVFSRNEDPKTTIEAMIDYVNTVHNFFSKDIELYGSSLATNYSYTYASDVLKDFASRTGKYYFIESDGTVSFKTKPVTATHTLDFWYDVQKITSDEDIIDAVNSVYMQYTGWYSPASDATSISNIGTRESKEDNSTIGNIGSWNDAASKYIAENKNAKMATTLVLNSRADLLAIKPWDTITVRGVDLGITNLQVYKKTYNINNITLELEKVTTLASVIFT